MSRESDHLALTAAKNRRGSRGRVTNVPPLPLPVSVKMSLFRQRCAENSSAAEGDAVISLQQSRQKTQEVTTKEVKKELIFTLCSWKDIRGGLV